MPCWRYSAWGADGKIPILGLSPNREYERILASWWTRRRPISDEPWVSLSKHQAMVARRLGSPPSSIFECAESGHCSTRGPTRESYRLHCDSPLILLLATCKSKTNMVLS